MTDHEHDPLDEVIADFQRIPLPDTPDHAVLLSRLTSGPAERYEASFALFSRARSLLMRPAFRYFSAAAILLGTLAWFALGFSSSVAFAEVIKATEQHKLVRYQLRQIDDYKKHGAAESTRTVHADLTRPRLRFEHKGTTLNKVLEFHSVMVQDNQKARFLKLISNVQIVDESHADALQAKVIKIVKEKGLANRKAYLYDLTQDDGTPLNLDDLVKGRTLLESLHELQSHADTVSTRDRLDGREVLKYRLPGEGPDHEPLG